jgi:hypothetical protein
VISLAVDPGVVGTTIASRQARQKVREQGKSMGTKWIATLKVEFEMIEPRQDRLARVVLTREVGRFRVGLEQGIGLAPTSVRRDSAKVEIVSQGSL